MPRIERERWARVDGAAALVVTFEDGVEATVTRSGVVLDDVPEAHRDAARWRAEAVVRLGACR